LRGRRTKMSYKVRKFEINLLIKDDRSKNYCDKLDKSIEDLLNYEFEDFGYAQVREIRGD